MKKLLSVLLTLALIISAMPLGVFNIAASAETATSGTTGDCTWTLDGTVLTISGNGAMENYSWSTTLPWGTDITEVVINDGVSSIGSYAFFNCSSLTSIAISNTVTSIGERAFDSCYSLNNLTIPNSVTSIGVFAFNSCMNLVNITLSNKLSGLSSGLFASCYSLTNITIPNSVISIGEYVFQHCTELISITIPDITSIGNGFLFNCSKLEHIFYGGTKDKWDLITKQEDNSFLTDITTHTESDGPVNIVGCEINRTVCMLCNKVLFAVYAENGTHTFVDKICSVCGINKEYNITYYITDDEGNWGCNAGKKLKITGFYGNMAFLEVPTEIEGLPVNRICSSTFVNCWSLKHIFFSGDAPIMENDMFEGITATCYYPANNDTWTDDILLDYGGSITWVQHCGEIPTVITKQPWSVSVLYGATVNFSTSTNKKDVVYQWQYKSPSGDWMNAYDAGYSTETLTVLFSEGMENYQYRCMITDPSGNIIHSDTAELMLLEATELQLGVTIPRAKDIAYGIPQYYYFTPSTTDAYTLIGSDIDFYYYLYDLNMQYIEWNEEGVYILQEGHTYVFETDVAVQENGVMTLIAVHNYICDDETEGSCADDVECSFICTYCNDVYKQIPHSFVDNACINCGKTFYAYGDCGKNLKWELTSDGTLTLLGTGYMTDYSSTIGQWYKYAQNITKVVIENDITHIGDYAFSYCYNVTDVVLPKSLNSIGTYAFNSCYNLENVWYGKSENDIKNVEIKPFNDHLTSATWHYTEETYIEGDINGDTEVNAADLALLKKVIAGLLSLEDTSVINPDVDGEGEIPNAADLALLKKMIAGLV